MKKTNIIICDVCKEKIAKEKCNLCGIDLCSNYDCSRKINLKLKRDGGDFGIYFNDMLLCKECEDKFFKLLDREAKEILDKDNKIKKIIIERVKKNLMLENLKDKKEVT